MSLSTRTVAALTFHGRRFEIDFEDLLEERAQLERVAAKLTDLARTRGRQFPLITVL